MCSGRFGGLTKVAQQRGRQYVLNQRGLARTTHASDAHQPLQRNLHGHVFEVVLGCAFQNQARRVGRDHAFEAHAHLLATAQVGTSQGVGPLQRFGRAIKHNLSAFLARTGAHVDHAVGGHHHRRVVLDHHQRVAGIAQALHGYDDAVHIARVQANARLIQHEQRVDQRGAQGRGQVNALHFAATQGSALAIQGEIANAHIAQVFEAVADFVEQQFEGLLFGFGGGGCIFLR